MKKQISNNTAIVDSNDRHKFPRQMEQKGKKYLKVTFMVPEAIQALIKEQHGTAAETENMWVTVRRFEDRQGILANTPSFIPSVNNGDDVTFYEHEGMYFHQPTGHGMH